MTAGWILVSPGLGFGCKACCIISLAFIAGCAESRSTDAQTMYDCYERMQVVHATMGRSSLDNMTESDLLLQQTHQYLIFSDIVQRIEVSDSRTLSMLSEMKSQLMEIYSRRSSGSITVKDLPHDRRVAAHSLVSHADSLFMCVSAEALRWVGHK